MFIIAQLPLADFRPLVKGQKGRLQIPDWTSDNLNSGFVRGFGKISTRNGSGLGLEGEQSFADADNAIRFIEPILFRQDGWRRDLMISPWFRRLYYDGELAGRFECGFFINEMSEDIFFNPPMGSEALDPALVAQAILSTNVRIESVDGSQWTQPFARCSKPLGLAYLAATTSNAALNQYPISETYSSEVFVGKPTLHMRIASERLVKIGNDRRYLSNEEEAELFITSARGSDTRNNVLVQASVYGSRDESASERVTRVLFSHLNGLLFAHSQFVKTGKSIAEFNSREILRKALQKMIKRFSQFAQMKDDHDSQFVDGMHLFAKAYAGRIDELIAKLEALSEEWNKPNTIESVKGYFKGLHDLSATTAIKTMVETVIKGAR